MTPTDDHFESEQYKRLSYEYRKISHFHNLALNLSWKADYDLKKFRKKHKRIVMAMITYIVVYTALTAWMFI